jgi:hypothetical protein
MSTVFATDGIVTRVNDVGASDKLINIITPNKTERAPKVLSLFYSSLAVCSFTFLP